MDNNKTFFAKYFFLMPVSGNLLLALLAHFKVIEMDSLTNFKDWLVVIFVGVITGLPFYFLRKRKAISKK